MTHNIDSYLDKTNVASISTPPRTLFPVSVVSVRTIFPRVSFLTSGTNYAFVTFRSISTVAAW